MLKCNPPVVITIDHITLAAILVDSDQALGTGLIAEAQRSSRPTHHPDLAAQRLFIVASRASTSPTLSRTSIRMRSTGSQWWLLANKESYRVKNGEKSSVIAYDRLPVLRNQIDRSMPAAQKNN